MAGTPSVACLPKGIKRVTPSRMRPLLTRGDLIPFLVLHAAFWHVAHLPQVQDVLQQFAAPLLMGVSVVIHLLAFLFQVWSMRWFQLVRCVTVPLARADCLLVEPEMHAGAAAVVPLKRASGSTAVDPTSSRAGAAAAPADDVAAAWLRTSTLQFSFQSCTYQLVASPHSPGGVAFDRLDCPDSAPVHVYTGWHGWRDSAAVAAAEAKYGPNTIFMPAPTFRELMLEHALAPFFVFQIGCVGLWALDDYWYYSLFTLGMLVALEAALVGARMMQQKSLRGMRPTPLPILAFRSGRWGALRSDQLVPGDIVSVSQAVPASGAAAVVPAAAQPAGGAGAATAVVVCPADILLLRGSVVVNEAMLTGESAPQMKDAITCDETVAPPPPPRATSGGSGGDASEPGCAVVPAGHSAARLNAFLPEGSRSHTRHIVYGGTTVMQSSAHSASDEEEEGGGGGGSGGKPRAGDPLPHIPPPPDGGATGAVLRTGGYTSQGELMRTIQHSTSKVSAGNAEAFYFICGLLVFALYSSHYVLTHAWNDPARNRWKLILHCIMIITSVVPPELPVELALAVNASIAALARSGIFCTEPWRVTLAGKVDVAAFDKTGTLTSDEFTVNGVVLLPEAAPGAAGEDAAPVAQPAAGRPVLVPAMSVPLATLHVLAGCHSLMGIPTPHPPPPPVAPRRPGQPAPRAPPPPPAAPVKPLGRTLIGDPLEKSTLVSLGWTVTADGVARPRLPGLDEGAPPPSAAEAALMHPHGGHAVRAVKRWPFSAEVKRMSCAVTVVCAPAPRASAPAAGAASAAASAVSSPSLDRLARSAPSSQLRIVVKGAPEVMAPLLSAVPRAYHDTYRALTLTGARVLTLAYRVLPSSVTAADVRTWPRARAECGLTFAGFLALSSPLKTDSVRTVSELTGSGHRVMMITGDAPFTAVAVAQQCGIIGDGAGAAVPVQAPPPAARRAGTASRGGAAADGSEVWILEQPQPQPQQAGPAASEGGGGGDFGLSWSVVRLPPRSSDTSSTAAVAAVVKTLGPSPASGAPADGEAGAGGVRIRTVPLHAEALLAALLPPTGAPAAPAPAAPSPATPQRAAHASPPPGAAICVTGAALRVLNYAPAAPALPLALRELAAPLTYALCLTAAVFARVSPDQKEGVIVTLNAGGGGGGADGSDAAPTAAGAASAPARRAVAAGARHTTLMCGDGTNDVGALKQAGVGVSIISNPALERQYDMLRLKQASAAKERREAALQAQVAPLRKLAKGDPNHMMALAADRLVAAAKAREEVVDAGEEEELTSLLRAERASATLAAPPPGGDGDDPASGGGLEGMLLRSLAPPVLPADGAAPSAAAAAAADPAAARRAEMNRALADKLKELQGGSEGGGLDTGAGGPVMVALGDASIASPFTSKLPSPGAVVEILRQGRCTLVTTHQMYKILAVNSLVLSYQLSVLYLHGVKGGDYQATIGGMSVAAFFFFISWAKPLKRLAPVRPHTSVFNAPLLLAVAGQFLVHLAVLATAVRLCVPYAAVDAALTRAAGTLSDPLATLTSEDANAGIRALLAGGNWSLPENATAPEGDDAATAAALADAGAIGGSSGPLDAAMTDAATVNASEAAALMAGFAHVGEATLAPSPPLTPPSAAEVDEFSVDATGGVAGAASAAAPRAAAARFTAEGDPAVDLKAALLAKRQREAASDGSAAAGSASGVGTAQPTPKPKYLEDVKFAPNIINTVVFLVSVSSQASTFVVNYTGKPFMQPLSENRGLLNLAAATILLALLACSGLSSDLLSLLQLVELPTVTLKASVGGLILLDAAACVSWEWALRRVFGVGVPVRAPSGGDGA